jgi:2-iminobutanoate/2-iminopropanoate deaminase
MFDPFRRKMITRFPLIAGAGLALSHGGNEAEAIEPNPPTTSNPPKKKVIPGNSPNLSRAIGFEHILFVSGVLGVDSQTRKLVSAEFDGQCRQALTNLKASVEAGGSSLSQVLKCTCFLVEAADFEAFNKVYREFFPQDPPARSTVVVKELVMAGAKIEIDCVAHL